jgi:PPOX class probable F420-dependent enzyme
MPDHHELPVAVRDFLAAPRVASIATIDPDGAPRQTVAWYRLEDDGRILLNSRTPRRWCTNLLRDPRLALSVLDDDPYRWLGLTGLVDEVIDEVERARDDIVALAYRYAGPEGPDPETIATFRTQPRVTFLVRVTGIHDHTEG